MNATRLVTGFIIAFAAAVLVLWLVVGIALALTASPAPVPCADPFGPGGTVTHLWCKAPEGVTP